MRLLQERRGATGVLVAMGLPMLLGAAALAVDVGAAQLEARRLQGVADAAALAAAVDPAHAAAAAQAVVDGAHWPRPVTVTTTIGGYARDTSVAPAARFTPNAPQPDAARVSLAAESPAYLARALGIRTTLISRSATAARERLASLSIGTRLASLDGGLLNAYLSALTGSRVSLSVMDYQALAGADIDLFSFVDALHARAGVTGPTYGDTLGATVAASGVLGAAADALGTVPSAGAMRRLADIAVGSIALGALIDAGPLASQASGGRGIAKVNALALLTTVVQTGSGKRQIALDLGTGVPGVAQASVIVAVGERLAQSPWITIARDRTSTVRTAQTRLLIDAQLAPAPLAGLGAPVAIRVPLFVELASGEARLERIGCAAAEGRHVTVSARPGLGQAAIAAVDRDALDDFRTPIAMAPARLVQAPLLAVDGQAFLDLGQAEPWQERRFDQSAIDAGAPQSVASAHPVASLAGSLVEKLQVTARIVGLPVPLDVLTRSVGGVLGAAAPSLDTLIGLATGTLGVKVGEADVRVTGMRCGTAVLVG